MKRKTPAVIFACGMCILAVGFLNMTVNGLTGSLGDTLNGSSDGSRKADEVVTIGEPATFTDGSTLVVTVPIHKDDPNLEVYGGSLRFEDRSSDYSRTWESIPTMTFNESTTFVTAALTGASADPDLSIGFDEDDDEVYVTDIQEYDYLKEGASVEELRELYLSNWNDDVVITIDSDDHGRVDYTVKTADGNPASMYGRVQIRFMQGDTCIFSADEYYEGPHSQDTEVVKSYHCPYSLPDYTSVEIVPIS